MITHEPNMLSHYEGQLRTLVDQHLQLDDLLALAVGFVREGEQRDLYLIEVLEKPGWPGDGFIMDGKRDFFETEVASTPGFPMASEQKLHLILTNPVELPHALASNWPLAAEFRKAIMADRFIVLSGIPEWCNWLEKIRRGRRA